MLAQQLGWSVVMAEKAVLVEGVEIQGECGSLGIERAIYCRLVPRLKELLQG
jgi:hypothetical protein